MEHKEGQGFVLQHGVGPAQLSARSQATDGGNR